MGLEQVFVFDSKSENRNRDRVRVRVRVGSPRPAWVVLRLISNQSKLGHGVS